MRTVFTQDAIVYPVLQHPRGTQPLTPAMLDALTLASYLGSWHHSDHMVRGRCEAHPGHDRERAAMGWDEQRHSRAVAALYNMGLWQRYNSPSTVEGKAWTLPVDLTLVPLTEGWRGRCREIEAVLKCIVRGTPDLSSEARLLAVILAARLIAWRPELPVVMGTREVVQRLLPGVDLTDAMNELVAAQVYERCEIARAQKPAVVLHSDFFALSVEYMNHMGRADRNNGYGRHGETEWERAMFAKRGQVVLNRAAVQRALRKEERQYVYMLRDPRERLRDSFYVGITISPEDRERSHREAAGTGDGQGTHWSDDNYESNPAKRARFEEIEREGFQVFMEVISPGVAISEEEAKGYERMLVQGLLVLGLPLVNIEYVKGQPLPRMEDAQRIVERALAGFGLDAGGIRAFMGRLFYREQLHNRTKRSNEGALRTPGSREVFPARPITSVN